MNKQDLIQNFNLAFVALTELVNNWDNDTQALFEQFIAQGGTWTVPSLDEVYAEFAQFIIWLDSRA
jgi:hypothetical protein